MEPLINGIPLIAVIVGLVEFYKRLGLRGRASLAASLLTGTALGLGYALTRQPPASPAEWFAAAVYGLALGLTACGLYDLWAGKSRPE
jgi:hypothetical protein